MTISSSIIPTLLVMTGGGVGAALRFNLGRLLQQYAATLPLGTFAANILGGLLMGILMAIVMRSDIQGDIQIGGQMENYRLLIGVGLLGGFTTFSAFSLEMAMMIERGDWMLAFGYALASVVLALLALLAGMSAMKAIL